jgi:hypothetical protein
MPDKEVEVPEAESGAILSFFKKIGLPGIIAALVSAIVTMIPFLFQLDERYAKADDTNTQLTLISKQISDLTIEVGRLAGTQQVMVAIMSAKPEVRYAPVEPVNVPTQIVRNAPAPVASIAPVTVEPPIPSTVVPKTSEERKTRLEEVTRSLEHTQSRVLQIQQLAK